MAALFFVSSAIQVNDPDPWRWVVLYGGAGAACLLAGLHLPARSGAALVGLVSLAWAVAMLPGLSEFRFGDLFRSMKAESPSIEAGREILGLLIVAAWMIVVVAGSRPRPRRSA